MRYFIKIKNSLISSYTMPYSKVNILDVPRCTPPIILSMYVYREFEFTNVNILVFYLHLMCMLDFTVCSELEL